MTDNGNSVIMVATILAVQTIFITERRDGMIDGSISFLKVSVLVDPYVYSRLL